MEMILISLDRKRFAVVHRGYRPTIQYIGLMMKVNFETYTLHHRHVEFGSDRRMELRTGAPNFKV